MGRQHGRQLEGQGLPGPCGPLRQDIPAFQDGLDDLPLPGTESAQAKALFQNLLQL